MLKWIPAAAAAVIWCAPAVGQSEAPSPTIAPLTPVRIMIMEPINSATTPIGTRFAIKLADPIVIDATTSVPAGIDGEGEVVHAAKSRFGGRPGELILAARFLDWNGRRIPLRSFSLDRPGQGKDNGTAAMATAVAVSAVLAMFITGGEVNIPAGTIANAKVAAPPPQPAAGAPVTTPSTGEAVK